MCKTWKVKKKEPKWDERMTSGSLRPNSIRHGQPQLPFYLTFFFFFHSSLLLFFFFFSSSTRDCIRSLGHWKSKFWWTENRWTKTESKQNESICRRCVCVCVRVFDFTWWTSTSSPESPSSIYPKQERLFRVEDHREIFRFRVARMIIQVLSFAHCLSG